MTIVLLELTHFGGRLPIAVCSESVKAEINGIMKRERVVEDAGVVFVP